jgi:glycosyltransferase involved in cell wall biosynthesis
LASSACLVVEQVLLLQAQSEQKKGGPKLGPFCEVEVKITVIVCTLNRCQSLAKTLDSVASSELAESVNWEVLVVDNNSSDQTRDVVQGFCTRYPGRFRYILELRPGKSSALNSGIRQARGDVLAFIDDDVTVQATWLHNLTAPLRGGEWAGAGGRTLPAQDFTPPRWMSIREADGLVGILCAFFDLGDEACELHRAPYGANMAFRKVMFERYGGFRSDLGPSPNSDIPRPNEDTEFGRRLMAAGERLRYEPSAVVYHPINEDRVKKEYFLNWWFDYGRAMVREWRLGPPVWGIPRPYLSILNVGITAMADATWRWTLTLSPKRRFFWKCRVWLIAGQMKELYRFARMKNDHLISERLAS